MISARTATVVILLAHSLALSVAPASAAGKTTFSLRTYVEQNDNVSLVSDDEFAADPIGSTGAGVMLTVARTLYRAPSLELRGSIVAFHTAQLSSDAEDFDATGVVPRLSLTKRARLFDKPVQWTGALSLRCDLLGGEGFSRLIDLGAGLLVNVTSAWSMGPTYTLSLRDYDDEGFDPDTTSRNALRHTLGLTSQWRLPSASGRSGRFSLSASSQRNAADGRDFEFDGTVFGAALDLPLTRRSPALFSAFSLQASATFSAQDYDEFIALPRRSDQRLSATLSLSAQCRPLGAIDLTYTRFDIDSNRPEFDAARNLLRVGLTHTF